jgi:hypothetical protein
MSYITLHQFDWHAELVEQNLTLDYTQPLFFLTLFCLKFCNFCTSPVLLILNYLFNKLPFIFLPSITL